MRFILIGGSVILAILLQASVFPALAFLSVTPNILLILTVAYAILYGRMYGLFVGVVCGFLMDLYSGFLPGFTAMIFACMGYVTGAFTRTFDYEDYKLPAFVIIACDLVYGIVVYVTSFMIGGLISPFSALWEVILPEVVFTGLVTVFLYPLLVYFNRIITARSGKREKKFTADR